MDSNKNLKNFSKANLGIVGFGIVGQALANGFKKDNIYIYDKHKTSSSLEEVVEKSEFIFICLPTPMYSDEAGIDLSIIEENIAKIAPLIASTEKILVIKSTVIPGTTQSFQDRFPKTLFSFNPEFLREKTYLEDFLNPDRTIIGAFSEAVSSRLVLLYKSRFPKIPIYQTDPTSAEMVKYMANTYLSMKVIYANQIAKLCESLGISYPEVKKMVVADKRIEDTHLDVTSEGGFGGKCFPKDMVALIGLAKERGVDLSLLEKVWEVNKKIRKHQDWLDIPFATSKKTNQ